MHIKAGRRHSLARKQVQTLRRRLLPVLIAGCFGSAMANPVGPQVVNGQASFSQQGNVLSVTNSPGAILNWQSFSIGKGELTRFIQESASSSVLNRVIGQDPSKILGALQSNGRVFLINPNGILFGAGAQIDVNGLIASTLDISNEDFLIGKMRFNIGDKAGDLKNEGTITTPDGGHVYLIAPNVENSGIITSPKGEVLLAAGSSVQLVDSANPDLQVVVSAPENEAVNLGEIVAQGGKIGIYGALVRHSGIVNADSAVVGENGKIVFKASGETVLEDGSRTSATGAGKGGEVQVLGDRVALMGDAQIDVSGQTGGGTVLIGGDFQGKNAAVMNASRTYLGKSTTINADAITNGDGGKVIIWADESTAAYGKVSARGGAQSGNGGFVETSGKKHLTYRGFTDLRAPHGSTGTLLLDPEQITILGGSGDGDGNESNDTFGYGGSVYYYEDGPSVIYESEIEAQSASADIYLEAFYGIHAEGTFDDGAVTLASGSNLTLLTLNPSESLEQADVNYALYQDGVDGIDLTTSEHGADLEFRVQGNGSINISSGSGYGGSVEPVSVRVGKLSADQGNISVSSSGSIDALNSITTNGGNVLLEAGAGDLNVLNSVTTNGGYVSLGSATSDINLQGSVATNGGTVWLGADGNINVQGEINAGEGMVSLSALNGAIIGSLASNAPRVSGASLVASAVNGVSLTTSVDTLSIDNSGPDSDISILNYGPLTVYDVIQSGADSTGDITISNYGGMVVASEHEVRAERGNIKLETHSPLTINGIVTTTSTTLGEGNITLQAYSSSAPDTDNITINGSVKAEAGNIALMAGNNIIGAGNVTSTSGTMTLTPNLNSALHANSQVSNTIQTTIVAADTVTADSSGSTANEITSDMEDEEDAGDGSSDVPETQEDGVTQNEPAQKLYCN